MFMSKILKSRLEPFVCLGGAYCQMPSLLNDLTRPFEGTPDFQELVFSPWVGHFPQRGILHLEGISWVSISESPGEKEAKGLILFLKKTYT